MIYDVNKRILIKDTGKEFELTETEHKFIMCFKNDDFVTKEELIKNIYGYYDRCCFERY